MSVEFEKMNSLHMDVLREIGNIGAGNAATSLAKMINKKVDMDVPQVRILEFREVSDLLGGAEQLVAGLLLRIDGDLTGFIMFIIDIRDARILVDIIMNRTSKNGDSVFDDMEISALKELGNILSGSYIGSLSSLTGLHIKESVPDIAMDMAGAILSVPAIEFGKVGDTVLYIETRFKEGSMKVTGNFFLVPDIQSYDILLKALGVAG